MSYLEIGFLVGFSLGHLAIGVAAGLWLRERHWREIRRRAGV